MAWTELHRRRSPEGRPFIRIACHVGKQRITPQDWAVAATHGAWRSLGEGDRLGRLAPGMACDLCVLSRDVLAEGCADSLDWHVEATVVGGEVVYRKDDARET